MSKKTQEIKINELMKRLSVYESRVETKKFKENSQKLY